jgi:hypothetical protein
MSITGDVERYWNEIELQNIESDRRRAEIAIEAERNLLGSAPTTEEHIARRKAMPFLIVEPDLPLDEMSMQDYWKVRLRDRARAKGPQLRMGETSYADYQASREKK